MGRGRARSLLIVPLKADAVTRMSLGATSTDGADANADGAYSKLPLFNARRGALEPRPVASSMVGGPPPARST